MLAKAKKDRLKLSWEGDGICLVVNHKECREVTSAHRERATRRLTRYLGASIAAKPDTAEVDLRPGDVIVVLTDGVFDQLGHVRIADTVRRKGTANDCAKRLVKQAIATGRDDATAAVIAIRR
jgi:serine/threonine protein phosphatase PrpC